MGKLLEAAKRIATITNRVCGLECRPVDLSSPGRLPENPYCCACLREQLRLHGKIVCTGITEYAYYQADKWGGKYEFLCRSGCAFISTALYSADNEEYGVLAGPFLMVEEDDFRENDLAALFGDEISGELDEAVKQLPFIDSGRVPYLSDMINMLSEYLGERDALGQKVMDVSAKSKSEIYDSLLKVKESDSGYPIEIERMLQMYIAQGDRTGAQEALNDILGYIYFTSVGDFKKLKSRVIELMVLLSRAAIEGGAAIGEVFGLNSDYLAELIAIDDYDKLNEWLAHALLKYTSIVLRVDDTKHSDIIKKVKSYIRDNCTGKITLNEIADYVNFSVSYLSRMFKDETGENISAYINKARIDQAKALLVREELSLSDVAMMSGFEEQSYFNRVFKKLVGITPGRFREKQNRNNGGLK